MITRLFIIAGLIFIIICSASIVLLKYLPNYSEATVYIPPTNGRPSFICVAEDLSCGSKSGGDIPTLISDESPSDIVVSYEWPAQVFLNSSNSISVSLSLSPFHLPKKVLSPTSSGNNQIGTSSLSGIGTPSAIKDSFGPGYRISAIAQLLSTTFDMKYFEPAQQSLDTSQVTWIWNIKPNSVGLQSVDVNINILWKSTNNGQVIERNLWETSLPIEVSNPFYDRDQVTLGAILSGTLGSGTLITGIIIASIPILIEKWVNKSEINNDKEGEDNDKEGEDNDKEGEDNEQQYTIRRRVLQRRPLYPNSKFKLYARNNSTSNKF